MQESPRKGSVARNHHIPATIEYDATLFLDNFYVIFVVLHNTDCDTHTDAYTDTDKHPHHRANT